MAVKDVREYLTKVQAQYMAAKADLADFEQGLKDGYITEDRLEEVKDELYKIEVNYQRLLYIQYLLNEPQRRSKKQKYHNSNNILDEYFEASGATSKAVEKENEDALVALRKELKKIKEEIGK